MSDKSTCAIVMGVPRSGTSCVAGVLHQLGVNMGEGHFQSHDRFNKRGYYEDLRWRYTNQRLTGKGYNLPNIGKVGKQQKRLWSRLASECAVVPFWGVKDPWMCYVGRWVVPIIAEVADVKIIVVRRQSKASIASVSRHLRSTYKGKYKYGAERIIDHWTEAMDQTLYELREYPAQIIRYEGLVAHPVEIIGLLAQVVLGEPPDPEKVKEIADWVSPDMKHF